MSTRPHSPGAVVIVLAARRAQRQASALAEAAAAAHAPEPTAVRPALRLVDGGVTSREGEPGFTLERFLARARLVLASPRAHEPAPVVPLRRHA
jgi:hypothetical protein